MIRAAGGIAVGLRRRVGAGAVGVLVATSTLTVGAGVGRAGAQEASPQDIGDLLVHSMAGYVALPEDDGGGGGLTSGPMTLDELAGMAGVDVPKSPVGRLAGHLRVFRSPAGRGQAIAMGFEIGSDAPDFTAGIRHSAASSATARPLFPGEQPPLGDLVVFDIAAPGGSRRGALTAFTSGSVAVVLMVAGSDDNVAVLRQMGRDQAALTPPSSASPDSRRGAGEEKTLAYRLGEVTTVRLATERQLPASTSSGRHTGKAARDGKDRDRGVSR